jgi:acetyl-CoA synthetase
LSLLRLLITAGEVIDPEHFVWYQRGFGRGECPVINYTGGTEVSGALLANVMVRPIVPSGFNAVSPGVQVDVLDESGHPVLDQVGELAVLQPFVGMTKALWNDHDRYLETYWNRLPEVWVHGDLAVHRSDDGSFFLMGRSDDTRKIAGKRVGSAEIEEVLLGLSVVGEAAAIGVKDPVKGEKLIVFVVASRGDVGDHTTLPEEVSRVIERRLGKPFRPARVHVVAELPKTPSGKVMRRVIRNVYCGEQPGDLSALDNPEATDGIRSAAQSDQQLGG